MSIKLMVSEQTKKNLIFLVFVFTHIFADQKFSPWGESCVQIAGSEAPLNLICEDLLLKE